MNKITTPVYAALILVSSIVRVIAEEEAQNLFNNDPHNSETTNYQKASADDGSYTNFSITITIAEERIIDGKKETKILSKPTAGTSRLGASAGIKVTSTFTTAVPGYEELTSQRGDAGVILNFTPHMDGSDILLKGVVEIRKVQNMQSLKETGAAAVQSSTIVQFSLKAIENTPIKLNPIPMPDGSHLVLTFNVTAETENTGMERTNQSR